MKQGIHNTFDTMNSLDKLINIKTETNNTKK